MFELRIKEEFSAAHHLRGYPGDCARPHGHNWGVEVFVCSRELDSLGLATDFKTVKTAVRELIRGWDHQDLNQHPDFVSMNPSAEQIAKLVYQRLQPLFPAHSKTWVERVNIWENERCFAGYYETGNRKS